MALFSTIKDVFSDPAGYLPVVQEKGQHVFELMRNNPWASLGVATGTALLWKYAKAPRNLPPGPRNYPIIGATSCIYSDDLAKQMVEWRPVYGEVVSYYVMGQLYVVLNSDRVIKEAFVKRQEEFSYRSYDYVFETVGLKDDIFQAPYGETWKKTKKFAISTLKTFGFGNPKSEDRINEQIEQFEDFVMKLKGSPVDVNHQLRILRTGVISSIVFGGNPSWDDPDITDLFSIIKNWTADLSAAYMLPYRESNPTLCGILGRKTMNKLCSSQQDLVHHIERRIEAHINGVTKREPSDVIDGYLQDRGTDAKTIRAIADTVVMFLPDAIDTSAIIDQWMLLNLTCDQNIQKKVREEVDSVCGQSRNPTLADRSAMHYTQAVIHETLRMYTILPMSLPRTLQEDVTFEGYNLPKGTQVIANLYASSNDPEIFENPEKFDPSRFLKEDATFNSALASKVAAFSYGSRKCIGEPFFKVSSFLFLARLIQHFELHPDPSGSQSIERDESVFLITPAGFKMCFKPR